jgi:hypothetical protein
VIDERQEEMLRLMLLGSLVLITGCPTFNDKYLFPPKPIHELELTTDDQR